METWQIIVLVAFGIILVGIIVANFFKQQQKKKRKASITIDVPRVPDRPIPKYDVPTINVASQELEKTKVETNESITERHAEAAKVIREAVSNISDDTGNSDRQTKNESKLNKLEEEINNL